MSKPKNSEHCVTVLQVQKVVTDYREELTNSNPEKDEENYNFLLGRIKFWERYAERRGIAV